MTDYMQNYQKTLDFLLYIYIWKVKINQDNLFLHYLHQQYAILFLYQYKELYYL